MNVITSSLKKYNVITISSKNDNLITLSLKNDYFDVKHYKKHTG